MSIDQINDLTGFANGDKFKTPSEVREYFTTANMKEMFGGDNQNSQEELDSMAEEVIRSGWHMSATK